MGVLEDIERRQAELTRGVNFSFPPPAAPAAPQPKDYSFLDNLASGVDRYQAGLWAIPAAMGSESAKRRMLENEQLAAQGAQQSGAIQAWKDVHNPGDFGRYMGNLVASSLPYMGEFAVGAATLGATAVPSAIGRYATRGVAEGAARNLAARGVAATAAGAMTSYPSSVGDVLTNQHDQAGEFDLPAAAALGVPYAALNVLGGEALLGKIIGQRGFQGLAGEGGKSLLRRTVEGAATTGATEAFSETGQEVMNQLGRVAVDPAHSIVSPQALEAYKESAIGGALLGGMMGGGAHAIARPRVESAPPPPAPTVEPQFDISQNIVTPEQHLQSYIDDMLGVGRKAGVSKKAVDTAFANDQWNAPSGHHDETGTLLTNAEYFDKQVREADGQQYGIRDMFTDAWSTPVYFDPAPAEGAQAVNRRQMDLFDTATLPTMPVSTPLAGVPDTTVFTQTPIVDTLEGAYDLARARAEQGIPPTPPPNAASSTEPATPKQARAEIANALASGIIDKGTAKEMRNTLTKTGASNPNAAAEAIAALREIEASQPQVPPPVPTIPVRQGAQPVPAAATQEPPNAVQKQIPDAGVLRQEGQGVGLQEVGQGNQGRQVATQEGQAQGPVTAFTPTGLSANQKAAWETLQAAVNNNEFDQYVQPDGSINFQALAEASGAKNRQAMHSALKQVVAKVATQLGTTPEGIRDFLRQRTTEVRQVAPADSDMLGMPPDMQAQTVEMEDLFGAEGATTSMGGIGTVGGSQGAVGEVDAEATAMAAARPDPVYERRVAEANARNSALQDQVLSTPEAAEAVQDWDDMRSDGAPLAAELSKQDAYDWVLMHREMKRGEISATQLDQDQRDIERRYDRRVAREVSEQPGNDRPEPAGNRAAIEGATADRAAVAENPIERRVADLKRNVGPKQAAAIDKLVARYQGGDIDLQRLNDELDNYAAQVEDGVQFSITGGGIPLDRAVAAWGEIVGRFRAGEINPRALVQMFASTPASMQLLGLPNLPVRASVHLLDSKFNHGITDSALRALPSELADPRAVYAHFGDRGGVSFVFLTRLEQNGEPVVVVLEPNTDKPSGKTHYLATVTTKTAGSITGDLRRGHALYVGDVSALPGAKDALKHAKEKQGRAAIDVRELLTQRYNLPDLPTKVLYKADLVKLVESGQAKYTVAGETVGQPAAGLRAKLLRVFRSPYFFDRAVSVVDNDSQLPTTIRNSVQSVNGRVGGLYDAETNKVWLLAHNIPEGRELSVLLHEVGVHMGMKNLIGQANYDKLIKQLQMWEIDALSGVDTLEAELVGKARSRVDKAKVKLAESGETMSQRIENEELLAYFVEEAVKAGVDPTALKGSTQLTQWVRRMWNAMTAALIKLGVDAGKLTARDVVDLAFGAATIELNAEPQLAGPVQSGAVFSLTDTVVDTMPKNVQEQVRWVSDGIADGAKRLGLASVFTKDLVDIVSKWLPSAKAWYDAVNAREVARIEFEAKIDAIANDVDKLTDQGRKRTWGLIHDMTKGQLWAYQPAWRKEPVQIDPGMKQRFDALDPAEQAVLQRVFQHGHESLRDVQQQLDAQLEEAFAAKMARAKTDENRSQLERDKAKFKRLYGRKLSEMQGPYAPMRRVGSHVVVARSQQYKDAYAAKDETTLQRLSTDENHYQVIFTHSMASAQAEARKLRAAGMDANPFAKEYMSQQGLLPFEAFDQIKRMAEELDSAAAGKLADMVTDLYLQSLAEVSARKSEMKRSNIAGLTPDTMYKAFISKGKADAHYIAVLKHAKDIGDKLATMRAQMKAGSEGGAQRRDAYNELMKRYENSFNYDPSAAVGKLMAFNSVWMLLTKPAYYLYNASQPLMMSQPYMAQKFGYGKSMGFLLDAYMALKRMPSFNLSTGFMDLEGAPEDAKRALQELRDMGRLDITLTQELGARIHSGDSKLSKAAAFVDRSLKSFAQKVEMTNRVVTAIAAYRLAVGENMTHDAAVDYARKVIDSTHGDYSNFNAPRLFNANSFARIATQFRKFQLIQLSLMVREFTDMTKGRTAAEKWALSRALRYTLGHHALMAGALGLPAANLVALAFAALGDDDEPRDLELTLRRELGPGFFTEMLIHGFPAAALNANVSGNIGAGQMLSILPFQDFNLASREGYASTLVALSGPLIGGLGMQFADAVGYMGNGDYYKGMTGLMPSGLKSSFRAMYEAAEGTTNKRGDLLVSPEEITLWDTALKAVGIRTESDSIRQQATSMKYEFEKFFSERTSRLKKDYTEAYRSGDSAGMREARENWFDMQQFKRDYGFRAQPISNLVKAPMEQHKRERNTYGGVQFDTGNRRFVEESIPAE